MERASIAPGSISCPSCFSSSSFSMDDMAFVCDDCGEEFSVNDVQEDLLQPGHDFVWHPSKKF